MAQFEVIDRGCGIPEENMIRLFEPFFSTKREGMGMGLNICRSIVEFHHGRLTVARNDASGGTIMRFTLPLTTPTGSLQSVEIHAPSTPGSSSSKANP
jgi:signal transduction histidine kinase